jgi:hypothetical protein
MDLGIAALADPLLLARRKLHRAVLSSSYDRRGGNHDWSSYIRREGEAAVMADFRGPGCITRIWTADPQKGTVRIFLDDNREPAVQCPFEELFHRLPLTHGLGGESPERYQRAGAEHLPMGYTTYCPIPFRRACRITIDPEDDYLYYHINANLYPPGVDVVSYDPNRALEHVDVAQRVLAHWGHGALFVETSELKRQAFEVKAGEKSTIFQHEGPGAITCLRLYLPRELTPTQLAHVRDHVWLIAHFDDDEPRDPSIRAPIGPFLLDFGQPLTPRSLFVGREDGGAYYCFFAMPHTTRAKIQLLNRSLVDLPIGASVLHRAADRPDHDLLRFRTAWHVVTPFGPDHRDYDGLACRLLNLDGLNNVELLSVDGAGHFVGCGFEADFSEAPTNRAAGEGDEMFFVDDDPRLTMYGTGLEDYTNDAWGMHGYVGPLSGDAIGGSETGVEFGAGPKLYGYRLHIPDPVPFVRKGRFTLEHGTGNNCSGQYRSIAYWYMDPSRSRTRIEEARWEALRHGKPPE